MAKVVAEIDLKVGDPVWIDGGGRNGIRRATIEKVGSKFWTAGGHKIPLVKDCQPLQRYMGFGVTIYLTEKAMEDAKWLQDQGYEVKDAVSKCQDADLLKQIQALLDR